VLFFFPDDLVTTFTAKQVGFGFDDIMVRAHGTAGTVETNYGGKEWLHSTEDRFEGATDNIYLVGVERNMVTFHDNIVKGDFSNSTVAPGQEVTWKQILKAAEKWEFNPKGLKV
jgi:hypothetical protein